MLFNITFNNISVISWRSVLLVEETGVARENHRPVASYWQMLEILSIMSEVFWPIVCFDGDFLKKKLYTNIWHIYITLYINKTNNVCKTSFCGGDRMVVRLTFRCTITIAVLMISLLTSSLVVVMLCCLTKLT
jgi:hypothetical protein